jgi:hypothetical protein
MYTRADENRSCVITGVVGRFFVSETIFEGDYIISFSTVLIVSVSTIVDVGKHFTGDGYVLTVFQ